MQNPDDIANKDIPIDEEAILNLLVEANALQRGNSDYLEIDGKRWRIRPTSQRQNLKMLNLDYDVLFWQQELRREDISRRRAKRLNARIRRAYAKKAAHKILGRKLWLVPFAFLITWWRVYNQSEKVSSTINSHETIAGSQSFYLANLGTSKRALVLSTTQVGNAIEQRMKRGESTENMVKKDALPKKTEDSRSAARSKPPRTTRR